MKKLKYLIFYFIICNAYSIELGKNISEIKLKYWNKDVEFNLIDELKNKKVLINFWASWCTSCINELQELEALKVKYNKNYTFVAINAGEKKNKIKKFINKFNFSYEILSDPNRSYSKDLGVESLPRTIVLDKGGKIIF